MSPNDTVGSTVKALAEDPERRCIISGERAPKAGLTRLALGPDGTVAPDVRARAPGRGAWIGVDRATFETAHAKGKLKGALIRAFKTSAITLPDDLADRIETNLQRATLDRLGIESRGGAVLLGGEKIEQAARGGLLYALFHADDGAEDGRRKLDQAWRVGSDAEGSGVTGLVIATNRAILGGALGREAVVHIGITDLAAARRVMALLARWHGFIGKELPAWACALAAPRSSAAQPVDYVENEGF
jgi:predicted RNA-binding protein YlxR (DUF448 family)